MKRINASDAPKGYVARARLKGWVSSACAGCEFFRGVESDCWKHDDCSCTPSGRKDRRWVIFVKKEASRLSIIAVTTAVTFVAPVASGAAPPGSRGWRRRAMH
jgi:hypothetical protein